LEGIRAGRWRFAGGAWWTNGGYRNLPTKRETGWSMRNCVKKSRESDWVADGLGKHAVA
jgi:hypothetical protein